MSTSLLQLSLCAVTVIQLTSSQSTYDVNMNDVTSCGSSEQLLRQLVQAVSQLRRDVAALKNSTPPPVKGKL